MRQGSERGLLTALAAAAALGCLPAAAFAAEPGTAAAARKPAPATDPLPAAVGEILRSTALGKARVGVAVADLDDGKLVYAYNPDELLNPASNMKVLTTVAALGILGPHHRFATDVLFEAELDKGVLDGNLYLKGRGDPSLTTERLYALVRELKHRGLKEVKGDLVIDDTFFDAEHEGPGWEQDHSDSSYMAPSGAMSLNHNTVEVHVYPGESAGTPGRVELEPASDYLDLENRTDTAPKGALQRIKVASLDRGERQKIVVHGRLPLDREGTVFWRRVSNPAMYTGHTLKRLLKEQGIRVRRVRRGVTPWKLKPVFSTMSEPLAVLVYRLNKSSQNHMTEQLLKTLGAEVQGQPGTWEKGVAVVEGFLEEKVGIPRGSYVMRNGSGLNDVNRLSVRQLVKVLRYAQRQELVAPEFLASLPIAGVDGTTRTRMSGTDAEGRLRAKTGTLQNVTALSGFVSSVGGRRYVFSIVVNDFPGRLSGVLPAVDAIASAVASAGSDERTRAAVASAQPPPRDPSTPRDVLQSRILTYANLGKAKDPRNAPFLRGALRSERDPALRAVIAEALFLSDRRDSSAARAVLDGFEPTAEVYGRLRAAGRDLPVQPLVVPTLLELAAEGHEEALGKLLAVAALAGDDAALREELSHGLAEVGRTAPEELLASLKVAEDGAQASALELLARGIHASTPADAGGKPAPAHPFVDALRKASAGPEPRLATFATQLEARVAEHLASLADVPAPVAADAPVEAPPAGTAAPGGG